MLLSSLKTRLLLSKLAVMLFVSNNVFAAATVNPATEPLNSIAPYALSNTDLSSGTVKAYRPWFENGAWQGDLVEYDVSAGGVLSTTVTVNIATFLPETTDGGNWSARIQFNAKADDWWDTGRKVIIHNGTNQVAFRWDNLSAQQKTDLDSILDDADAALTYIRGDRSDEIAVNAVDGTLSGDFRARYGLLGDIIHSNPVYVGPPRGDFSLPGYTTYKTQDTGDDPSGQADRAGRIYVGANDGMLHVFDAATGNEVYAYVPSMIVENLVKLTADPFTHSYFVDGELSAGDADFDINLVDSVTDWRTILVGSLGSGGKGLFALDITNPDLASESTTTDTKILWEKTDTDIGNIHGKAQIARLPDGLWYVIAGNGYSSTGNVAKLLVVKLNDSNLTKVATDATSNNGLSAPTLVDINNDDKVDYGFAGDLQGNLWKFNFTNPASITATKLFAAGTDKPITTAPDVTRHPNGGLLVVFGTGSLLSEVDRTAQDTQTIYGIWDGAATPITAAQLQAQTLSSVIYEYDPGDGSTATLMTRTSTNYAVDWTTKKGWSVDLNVLGERLVTDPVVRAGRVQMVTHNTLAGADQAGDAWLLELNYLSGGTGDKIFFDLNADASIDTNDLVGEVDDKKIPVGVKLGAGSYSGPQIARINQTLDTMFINGLYLPSPPKPLGFELGSVIVDTDSPSGGSTASTAADSYCYYEGSRSNAGVDADGDPVVSPATPVERTGVDGNPTGIGGKTDGSHVAYDKAHGVTYIDYIDIEPLCNQPRADGGDADIVPINNLKTINRITETVSDYDKKFFIILGNADLSAGGKLTLGSKTWNVVEYQIMVMKQLELFKDGTNASLVDDDGDSLLFSINDLKNSGGLLRLSFESNALAAGGLLPTDPNCVSDAPTETLGGVGSKDRGRWRGGVLYIQAIDWDDFILGATYNQVVPQVPTDLYRIRMVDGVPYTLIEDDHLADGTLGQDTLRQVGIDTSYGGLRATASDLGETDASAFLYESTVFWDYGKGACYGSPSWEANVTGAANSSINLSLKNLLVPLEKGLEAAKVLLEAMIADGENANKIAKQRELVDKLQAKIDEIKASLEDDSIVNTGVPVSPTDATPELSPSLGPNFRTGRRTWIDLTP